MRGRAASARFLVYALLDPRSGVVRYIGKSSSGLARPRSHAYPSQLARDRSHKATWIRALLRDGLSYSIFVLETAASYADLNLAEIRWIAFGHGALWPLVNHTDGGDGAGPRLDLAARNRSRRGHAGRVQSWEERSRRSAALRGRRIGLGHVKSPEVRARIAASRRGQPTRFPRVNMIRINLLPAE